MPDRERGAADEAQHDIGDRLGAAGMEDIGQSAAVAVEIDWRVLKIKALPGCPLQTIDAPRSLDIKRFDDPVGWTVADADGNLAEVIELFKSEYNLDSVGREETSPTACIVAGDTAPPVGQNL